MAESVSLSPLSSPSLALSFSRVVSRLRAAGCVFAEDEARLILSAARTGSEAEDMVARRAAGLPLEHVVGWAEFYGLRIAVDAGVFVPRRRTEFLVGQAAALAAASVPAPASGSALAPPRAVVVDLCCGSGAVGAALVSVLGDVELHAADIDPAAVRCARRNIGAGGAVYEGDLYEPLPRGLQGRIDVLVANAPYVPTEAIALLPGEARDHEARVALDGGSDGLDVQRRVAAAAPAWLAPGGHLLVETSERQAGRTVAVFAAAGLTARVVECDELDATVVVGTAPMGLTDSTGVVDSVDPRDSTAPASSSPLR
ncbi:putative protein N(5)-glutamine methyltransferase [Streptomyces sp. NPDC008001]|uniref:putative protein N(5)-glutamine methyltransferase n=1 Tax=Streptomyces sp. NPDC008001 TaxID=3364804 RepID=UPI0036E8BEBB